MFEKPAEYVDMGQLSIDVDLVEQDKFTFDIS